MLRPFRGILLRDQPTEPLNERQFAGWEGGLAPAQDPQPLNTELTAQAEELFAAFRAYPSLECMRILSGGEPTFPTCELLFIE